MRLPILMNCLLFAFVIVLCFSFVFRDFFNVTTLYFCNSIALYAMYVKLIVVLLLMFAQIADIIKGVLSQMTHFEKLSLNFTSLSIIFLLNLPLSKSDFFLLCLLFHIWRFLP